jgi:hypothetical protein
MGEEGGQMTQTLYAHMNKIKHKCVYQPEMPWLKVKDNLA